MLSFKSIFKYLQRKDDNKPLYFLLYFSLLCLLFSSLGLFIDERILNYSPIWLKPFKFAISTIIFAITLIYFTNLILKQRFLKFVNWVICLALSIELIIIYLQAFRGRMSHFNFLTLEDMILFQSMAVAIILVWMSLLIYIFAFQKIIVNQNPIIPAIRIGLLISFLSMGLGFIMTNPSSEDLKRIKANKGPIGLTLGSHSIKEMDETKRVTLTSWAKTGGDLRIPHFIGLHASQILPLLGLFFLKINLEYRNALMSLTVVGLIYSGVILFTLMQALNGIPLFKQ